jgi:hypothetical protein
MARWAGHTRTFVDRKVLFYSSAGSRSRLAAAGAFRSVWDRRANGGDGSHAGRAVVRRREAACAAPATRALAPCGAARGATAGSFARRVAFSARWKSARSSASLSAVTHTTALRGSTATPAGTTICSRSHAGHASSAPAAIRSACSCTASGSRKTFLNKWGQTPLKQQAWAD